MTTAYPPMTPNAPMPYIGVIGDIGGCVVPPGVIGDIGGYFVEACE